MGKLIGLLFLAAIVFGIAGLAVTTEQTSAQQKVVGEHFELSCQQTAEPTGAGTKGEITCTLLVDLPDALPPIFELPDPLELTIIVSYIDIDGNGRPSPGDQLQCLTVIRTDTGTVLVERCRSDGPGPIPTPALP